MQLDWYMVAMVCFTTYPLSHNIAAQNDGYAVFLLHLCTSMGDPMTPSHTHSGFDYEYRCQCMSLDLLTVTHVLITIFDW